MVGMNLAKRKINIQSRRSVQRSLADVFHYPDNHHRPRALGIVVDQETAAKRDVVQEAFTNAWYKIESLREAAAFPGWFLLNSGVTDQGSPHWLVIFLRLSLLGMEAAVHQCRSGSWISGCLNACANRQESGLLLGAFVMRSTVCILHPR